MVPTFVRNGDKKHLVRYGTSAEQKYLLGDFRNTYDLLVINANMVSHTPAALAAFIAEKNGNKSFIIDPQTHAFQHNIALLQSGDQEVAPRLRKSIQKLVDAYGEPLLARVNEDSVVLPEDFSDPGVVRAFANNVGEFQLKLLRSHAEDKGLMDYYEFAGVTKAVTPSGVVAPYFYMEQSTVDRWLPTNLSLIAATADLYGRDHEVYAELVIAKDVLEDDAMWRKVAKAYAESPVDAVLVWIDGFSERDAKKPLLEAYADLVRTLGQMRPVVMLYGSYFSMALMRYIPDSGLAGVCHGLEYGEDRAVVPAVGGLPVSKFYYPALHKRVRFADAYKMAKQHLRTAEDFNLNVCNCKKCRDVMRQDPTAEQAFALYGKSHPVTFKRQFQVVTLNYPDTDTRDRCVQHYMWNKEREFRAEGSLAEVCDQLTVAYSRYQRILGLTEVTHCIRWAEVLRSQATR
jgi:hypothetical protein